MKISLFLQLIQFFTAMQPIFLIGYMGSGKTTLGKALAATMGKDFIDLDNYIERRFHTSVKELFATRGEDGFRDVEKRMLHEVADFENVIVACGGGTPCYFDNMEYMRTHGLTIYLTVPPERLVLRLTLPGSRNRRPLIANKTDEELLDFINDALAKRDPFYSQAEITFCSTDIENAEQTQKTAAKLAALIQEK